jgi:hypothetical protein
MLSSNDKNANCTSVTEIISLKLQTDSCMIMKFRSNLKYENISKYLEYDLYPVNNNLCPLKPKQ